MFRTVWLACRGWKHRFLSLLRTSDHFWIWSRSRNSGHTPPVTLVVKRGEMEELETRWFKHCRWYTHDPESKWAGYLRHHFLTAFFPRICEKSLSWIISSLLSFLISYPPRNFPNQMLVTEKRQGASPQHLVRKRKLCHLFKRNVEWLVGLVMTQKALDFYRNQLWQLTIGPTLSSSLPDWTWWTPQPREKKTNQLFSSLYTWLTVPSQAADSMVQGDSFRERAAK